MLGRFVEASIEVLRVCACASVFVLIMEGWWWLPMGLFIALVAWDVFDRMPEEQGRAVGGSPAPSPAPAAADDF